MDINLSISPAPSITTNYLVVAIYKTTAPAVVVSFQAFPAPHLAVQNVVFTDVDPGTYQVITYENTVAAVGGSIRHDFFYDPSFQTAEVRPDLFLKVGTTPNLVAGTTDFHDTGDDQDLADWVYEVDLRQSFGELQKTIDVQIFSDGFGLLIPGYTFQTDEIYILRFYPKITVITPTVTSANIITAELIVTADTSLVAGDIGKGVIIQGASPSLTLTLPAIATATAFKLLTIASNGGSHKTVTIKPAAGELLSWMGVDNLTQIMLGQAEMIWLYRSGSVWRVINASDGPKLVGEIVDQYSLVPLNTVYADGSLISRTTYARLWAYVSTLDASMLVDDATWNAGTNVNKGKYSTGDTSTTFRVPQLYLFGFVRGVNVSVRKAANLQPEQIGPHDHPAGTETDPAQARFNNDPSAHNARDWAGGPNVILRNASTGLNVGTENRPANVGVYKLIRI